MSVTDKISFFGTFLRHPSHVSSVIPTSSVGVWQATRHIPSNKRQVIVEYGSGPGVMGDHLTQKGRLTDDSMIIMIELTKEMTERLRKKFLHDPRVRVFQNSAEHVRSVLEQSEITQADVVITSIPFTLMPEQVVRKILHDTRDILSEGGTLIVTLVRKKNADFIRWAFPQIHTERVWWNIPPLWIFRAKKCADVSHPEPVEG